MTAPEIVILTHNGIKPIARIPDARVYDNPAIGHPWKRVASGHLDILRGIPTGRAAVALEYDARPRKNWRECIAQCAGISESLPYIVSLYVVRAPAGIKSINRPCRFPDGFHDFGLQGIYYSPDAVTVARSLFEAYVSAPLSADLQRFGDVHPARPPSRDGVNLPVDFWLYPALQMLGVDVYHYPVVQHSAHPSGCESPSHTSLLLEEGDLQ